MERIQLRGFKAFHTLLTITPGVERRNILLYGENGAGKTSLFEAIRLAFYKERLLEGHITIGAVPEQLQNERETFIRQNFLNKESSEHSLLLEINGQKIDSLNVSDYQCYMLSNADLSDYNWNNGDKQAKDSINMKDVLKNAFLPVADVDEFVAEHGERIIHEVNSTLETCFYEPLEVGIENDSFDVFMHSLSIENMRESNGLHNVFNESKIDLVRLLIILVSIPMIRQEEKHHQLLVLDDIMTSLDACNRELLAKFILEKFEAYQILIMTHNIGFYNTLLLNIAARGEEENRKWMKLNLYLTNYGVQMYDYDELQTADDILKEFEKGFLTSETVGPEIRKRFEADLEELAKVLQVGAIEESKCLIDQLKEENAPLYFKCDHNKVLRGDNLAKSISEIANNDESDANKIAAIKNEINGFTNNEDLTQAKAIIKEFRLYEKIFMHRLSHGSATIASFKPKEVRACISLLKSLEKRIKSIKRNIYDI